MVTFSGLFYINSLRVINIKQINKLIKKIQKRQKTIPLSKVCSKVIFTIDLPWITMGGFTTPRYTWYSVKMEGKQGFKIVYPSEE